MRNRGRAGPCLEISCETFFQPRIPAHLIWCILHTACTLFLGTHLKYNPPPYLRKLTTQTFIIFYPGNSRYWVRARMLPFMPIEEFVEFCKYAIRIGDWEFATRMYPSSLIKLRISTSHQELDLARRSRSWVLAFAPMTQVRSWQSKRPWPRPDKRAFLEDYHCWQHLVRNRRFGRLSMYSLSSHGGGTLICVHSAYPICLFLIFQHCL